jgi:hypothetical protein
VATSVVGWLQILNIFGKEQWQNGMGPNLKGETMSVLQSLLFIGYSFKSGTGNRNQR